MNLIDPNCPEGVCLPDALGFDCPHQLEREHMTTTTETPTTPVPVLPPERCDGLGELIYAHRLYMGLSPREMASRLHFDRRDYQRIERGHTMCPVGFLSKVIELVELFDAVADSLVEQAVQHGGHLTICVDPEAIGSWERNVAGRAAVIAAGEPDGPTITLTHMVRNKR